MLGLSSYDSLCQRESTERSFKAYPRTHPGYYPSLTPSLAPLGFSTTKSYSPDCTARSMAEFRYQDQSQNLMDVSTNSRLIERKSAGIFSYDGSSNFTPHMPAGFHPAFGNTPHMGAINLSPLLHGASQGTTSGSTETSPNSPSSPSGSDAGVDPNLPRNGLYGSHKKRPNKPIPEDEKDMSYWQKRKKNNYSARKSRESRRQKEQQQTLKCAILEQENIQLHTQLNSYRAEIASLKQMLGLKMVHQ